MQFYLLRHGDAEFTSESRADFERKLSEKGSVQAKNKGGILSVLTKGEEVSVFCSNARRTRETYKYIAKEIQVAEVEYHDKLYHANHVSLLEFFKTLNPKAKNVLFIGHNNAISDFASYLLDRKIVFPTCGLLHISFPVIDKWEFLGSATGTESGRWF